MSINFKECGIGSLIISMFLIGLFSLLALLEKTPTTPRSIFLPAILYLVVFICAYGNVSFIREFTEAHPEIIWPGIFLTGGGALLMYWIALIYLILPRTVYRLIFRSRLNTKEG